MMTRIQLLLGKVAEECSEIAHRALKAQQFGLDEVQDGQSLNNWERLAGELTDLRAICEMIEQETLIDLMRYKSEDVQRKIQKVETFIHLSQTRGMVEPIC
jgi:hypothetical protein